ncbi:MAG: hypothetical protein EOO13_04210 [Chitinophagaceae bacterium]|nr:MAG: hypothetical protein EOO13_04210 [Chitinophagaceae bacterium]
MITAAKNIYHREHFYRITALWVICEAFAGGIMHGFKVPFSGMMVSSLAVFCIVLLAKYVPSKTAILKATVIVAIFKLMLSPHSPPTAYVAVFFQGLVGQLLFLQRKFFTGSAIALAVLALVESAVQRILVLMILYGNEFWKAVDDFIRKVTGSKSIDNYSLAIAIGYIILHAIVGIFVGYFSARMVRNSEHWSHQFPQYLIEDDSHLNDAMITRSKSKKKKIRWVFLLAWILLLAFYLQSVLDPAGALLPKDKVLQILIRSALIIVAWYLFISPLIMLAIRKALLAKQAKNKSEINVTMQLLPEMKMIFKKCWQLSDEQKGYARLKLFLKILLMNVLKVPA